MDNLVIYAEVLREDISVFNCYGNIKICKELDRLETNKLSPTALERLSTRTYSNM